MIRVVVQNLARGGLKEGDGASRDRWPQLADRIRSAGTPDLVLLQECEGWTADSHRQLVRAEQDLDMDGLLAPSRTGLGTGILYRRETLGRRIGWNVDYAANEMHHGTGIAAWDVPGLPAPLVAASIHLTPYDAAKAASEANFAASRVSKFGPFSLTGGDINFAPAAHAADPELDDAQMRPYNRGSRMRLDNPEEPDRRAAATFAANGFVDAAWVAYERDGDPQALAWTGGGLRIDQLWVSAPVAPAVVSYQLLDEPAGASDHHGVAVQLDLTKVVTDDPWEYR